MLHTIPGLVTKCIVVQKIMSKQTFTHILSLHCDLGLQPSNPIFPQDTQAYYAVLSNQVWLQMDLQFRRFNFFLKSYFDYINPCCDLDTEDSKPIFPHDTLPHDNTLPRQVWLKKKLKKNWVVQEILCGHNWTHRQNYRWTKWFQYTP